MSFSVEKPWRARWQAQADLAKEQLARRDQAVHFVGVGGVGMASLAAHLDHAGYPVTGCDQAEGPLTPWLRARGIRCDIGHHPDHLSGNVGWVVRSPAVPSNHPELHAARERGLPVIDRGAVLPMWMSQCPASIAVAGTHGKTTTSCMIYHILHALGHEPAYAIGGQPHNQHGAAGGFGQPCFLAEADESDGSLLLYRPSWAVITHTELDHVDFFPDPVSLHALYRHFTSATCRGVVIPVGTETDILAPGIQVPTLTFSVETPADVTARNLRSDGPESQTFTLLLCGEDQGVVRLGVSGRHNVANALASLALIHLMGHDLRAAMDALATFRLPRRRFETIVQTPDYRVISDYAHHPTEILALLDQARQLSPRRIVAVFQPHRYSRTKTFAREFVEALGDVDHLVLVPVYSASEPFVEGGSIQDLARAFDRTGRSDVEVCDGLDTAWKLVQNLIRPGDLLLLIGAGDVDVIGTWAKETWI